jgi:hypothetical protein
MDKPLRKRSGSILLMELCITMIVLGFGLLMIMPMSLNAYMGMKDGRSKFAATLSGEKKMRELRISPYISNGSDKDTVDGIPIERSWTFQDINAIREIKIEMKYKSLRGTYKNLVLTGAVK